MANEFDNIELSVEEESAIKAKTPDNMPLNPTAQGYSGQMVRRFLAQSLIDPEGSVIAEFKNKMTLIKNHLEDFKNGIYPIGAAVSLEGAYKSLDGTLASNSDLKLPTEKAVKTYVDNMGFAFETVVNADAHKNNVSNPHNVLPSQLGVYTQLEMQTQGGAQLDWNNLINVPPSLQIGADYRYATKGLAPLSDVPLNVEIYIVDDGDGSHATYRSKATSGATFDDVYVKTSDQDWTDDHGSLKGLADDDHPQYHNNVRGDARYYQKSYLDAKFNENTTILLADRFIITNSDNGDNTFSYEDNAGNPYIGNLIGGVYEFTLVNGLYMVGHNRIEAKLNDSIIYQTLDDELIEVGVIDGTSNTIQINKALVNNDEVYFSYHQGTSIVAAVVGDGTITMIKLAQSLQDSINHSHPYLPLAGGTLSGDVITSGEVYANNDKQVYHPGNKPKISDLGSTDPFVFTLPSDIQWVDDTVDNNVNGAYYYDLINVAMNIGANDKVTIGVQEDNAQANLDIADAQIYKFDEYDASTIRVLAHANNDISSYHLVVEIERK